ncbi:MAG: type II secretion system minor pseudopilin GspI [Pseudomonadales bacterium]|nr:type II secretion system minor pseudopilin GspI [Pseudomonadales bacterium]
MTRRPSSRAFTLLELLVALAVLALVSMAVFTQGGNTTRQLHDLEQRTLARWVAENEVAKRQLARLVEPEPVRTGVSRDLVSYGDRAWRVVTDTESTDYPDLHRLEITVYAVEGGSEVGPVDILTTFLGEH